MSSQAHREKHMDIETVGKDSMKKSEASRENEDEIEVVMEPGRISTFEENVHPEKRLQ
jgi:hypothetical protein